VSQGARPTTTVAPQALLLMNSPQVRSWAEALAQRAQGDAKSDPLTLAQQAYSLALARSPSATEAQDATAFLQHGIAAYTQAGKENAATLAVADLCQVLFGLNEFAYLP
jgi:hypothetical protein